MLARVGLQTHLAARPSQLSGGEQACAALALAVARATPVLLVDEPTAELDREAGSHVLELLADAATRGMTIVVATHDPDVTAAATMVVNLAGAVPEAPVPSVHHRAAGGTGVHPRAVGRR
jgi:putative ABC transport system ATP-binding protein